MAKVEYDRCGLITAIHGKLGNLVYHSSKNGKLFVKLYQPQIRKSPLSEKEIQQRNRFFLASQFVSNLSPEEKKRLNDLWRKNRKQTSGKRYATFRGFAMAYFLSNHSIEV